MRFITRRKKNILICYNHKYLLYKMDNLLVRVRRVKVVVRKRPYYIVLFFLTLVNDVFIVYEVVLVTL